MSTQPNLKIRLAGHRDASSLVEFNMEMAIETEGKSLDRDTLAAGVGHLLDNPRLGFYVVAEDESRGPVGGLLITYEWSDWRNGIFWWIQSVYVKPQDRRRGIYRRLYSFVRDLARDEPQVCGFRLYVERENLTAQRTYERLGMQQSHYLMFEEELGPRPIDDRD